VDKWTEFEIIPISEFEQVAKENEYFFWHFVSKDVLGLSIIPLGADYGDGNSLQLIRESFTEDSVDFLINLGLPSKKIKDKAFYVPSFFGFHRRRMVESTINHCYCREGITDIIYKTNPKFFESFLSVEEENLK
jgi:hypothetical protein